ncbi:MAG TPA: hypothetical protein VHR66_06525 [Gemmataceae bacterium]|jgi:hypothetical protein|nr:hypothetical protein [Gemmataceae bacterium]
MQVAALQLYLRSLAPALEAGDAVSAARSLSAAVQALEPFRALGVAEFAAFLHKADEYQRTGLVRVPGPGDVHATRLFDALTRLDSGDAAAAQQEVAAQLAGLAESAGLKGTLKADPKWAEERAVRARAAPHIAALRTLANRIASPEHYADESVRSELLRLESALDAATLRIVGAEFGVSATARTAPAKVIGDVLAKLSGHKPAKATKKAAKTEPPVDPAVVEEHTRRLSTLVARSADPDSVSDADVDAELADLKKLPKSTVYEVATRAGIDGLKPADSAKAILARITLRLTAARRARERAEV